jgi:ribosomal protein S18 acetylase RimI-like enzyme
MRITLRPETEGDEPFLRRLAMAVMEAEPGVSGWPAAVRDRLLDMQYEARRRSRRTEFTGAVSRVIQADAVDAGWVVTASLPGEIRVVEIMVSPELRGRGVGTAVMNEVMAEAARLRRPVRLSVDHSNPDANLFYLKLGFERSGGDELRSSMEYKPAALAEKK